jgi:hypothetical protein
VVPLVVVALALMSIVPAVGNPVRNVATSWKFCAAEMLVCA